MQKEEDPQGDQDVARTDHPIGAREGHPDHIPQGREHCPLVSPPRLLEAPLRLQPRRHLRHPGGAEILRAGRHIAPVEGHHQQIEPRPQGHDAEGAVAQVGDQEEEQEARAEHLPQHRREGLTEPGLEDRHLDAIGQEGQGQPAQPDGAQSQGGGAPGPGQEQGAESAGEDSHDRRGRR